MLELDLVVGSKCKACALVDSSASHNFLNYKFAERVGLMVDTTVQLNVHLTDGEVRASLGLARGVSIKFLPSITQKWDFCVFPVAMDAILGTLWLCSV